MFQKILVPSDGSRSSLEAAKIAAEIASHHGGTVTPLVAVEFRFLHGHDVPAEVSQQLESRVRASAQRALESTTGVLQSAGARLGEGKIVEAPPVEAILKEAEDGEFDLVVMGSRGVSLEHGYERLVGSVTERVLHRTPCPVLVVRAEPRP